MVITVHLKRRDSDGHVSLESQWMFRILSLKDLLSAKAVENKHVWDFELDLYGIRKWLKYRYILIKAFLQVI